MFLKLRCILIFLTSSIFMFLKMSYIFGVCRADFKKSRIPPPAVVPKANNAPPPLAVVPSVYTTLYLIYYFLHESMFCSHYRLG